MEIINATDGYKLGHHRMYPEGTEQVYSNWTPRSNKYFPEATEGSVVFGIQLFSITIILAEIIVALQNYLKNAHFQVLK